MSEIPEIPEQKIESILTLREQTQNVDDLQIAELAKELSISRISARLLLSRGFSDILAAKNFLNPTLRHQLPNPNSIKNIEAAVDLIIHFIKTKEQITIYNDFDVDGLSSGSQLYLFLKALGAKVEGYTPSRFTEGYGLVVSAVEKLAKNGTKLLITVDCGISSVKEIEKAKELGLKSIILDHHIPHHLPDADVIVDPAQEGCPFGEFKLAAAGLIWMLLIVLRNKAKDEFQEEIASGKVKLLDPKDFLDLAALGTICDMVPLVGLNRVIAHRGLEALRDSQRLGVVALKRIAGIESAKRLTTYHVGFNIGPRINAAGRLGDANQVFTLLTTEDSIKAKAIAESLDRLNDKRRQVEENVKEDCLIKVGSDPQLMSKSAFAIYGEDYHLGVIGIVAQRLVEQFKKPAAIMAPGEMIVRGEVKKVIKGSIRSVKGFHVAEALQEINSLLITGGGHAEAGGFSLHLDNLEKFQEAFINKAAEKLTSDVLRKEITADISIKLSEIDLDIIKEFQLFAPFGVGNPSPVLVTKNLEIDTVSIIGDKHLKFRVSDGKNSLPAIAWGMQRNPLLRKGKTVNIAYSPELNLYQGVSSIQLSVKDVWE
ncbi:MAG: single-stranded-DNA-specific exonuclease RecJ [Proteobacteria bacterium]|nr:single-stranded-DNA-specific exonuclease RecJ [Pseudomonadota bacterium]